MSNNLLAVDNVSKWYPVQKKGIFQSKSFVKAIDGVSFSLDKGEILGIIGESGCGKSTLGRILTRLEEPTGGDVSIGGMSTKELMKNDPKEFRRLVQIIFQNPYDCFTPKDTIEKILLRTLNIHGIGETTESKQALIEKRLEKGGLYPGKDFMGRYPHQLSGGQLQRISIIRAMLLDPKVLIADEPVSMLDVSVRADIINMLLKLRETFQTTIVFISHDISLTRYISDEIAVMYLGRIVEYGSTEQIIQNPQHPYTKVLLSNCFSLDPEEKTETIFIEGEPATPIDLKPSCYFAPRCYMASKECYLAYPAYEEVESGHFAACIKI